MKKLLLLLGLCCFAAGAHAQSVNITNVAKVGSVPAVGWALGLTSPTGPTVLIPYSTSAFSNVTLIGPITVSSSNPNSTFNGIVQAQGFDRPTNTWGINTDFGLGSNSFAVVVGAVVGGFSGVGNLPTSTARNGELTLVVNTGDLTWTNPVQVRTSDMVSSRTITNGNTAVIAVEVLPNRCTNMAIVQFK